MAGSWWGQKYHRYERLSLPVVVLVLVVVLTAVVLIPQVNGAIEDNREIGNLRENLATLTAKAQLLGDLDANTLTRQTYTLTQALPNDNDVGFFLAGLRSAGFRSGGIVTEIELLGQPGEAVAQGEGVAAVARKRVPQRQVENAVLVRATLQGDIFVLKNFLDEVSRALPLATIVEITGGGTTERLVVTQITLKYYYVPLPKALGTVSQAVGTVTSAEEQMYNRLVDFVAPEASATVRLETGNPNLFE